MIWVQELVLDKVDKVDMVDKALERTILVRNFVCCYLGLITIEPVFGVSDKARPKSFLQTR